MWLQALNKRRRRACWHQIFGRAPTPVPPDKHCIFRSSALNAHQHTLLQCMRGASSLATGSTCIASAKRREQKGLKQSPAVLKRHAGSGRAPIQLDRLVACKSRRASGHVGLRSRSSKLCPRCLQATCSSRLNAEPRPKRRAASSTRASLRRRTGSKQFEEALGRFR